MKFVLPLSLIFSTISLLSFSTTGSSKPTNSMTRIQEVFRTLMGANKPMMIESRGKKAALEPYQDAIAEEVEIRRLPANIPRDYRTLNDALDASNNNHDQQRIIWLLTGENVVLPTRNN